MSEAEIEAIGDPASWAGVFDGAAVAALRLADVLSGDGTHALESALVGELRSQFEEPELAELILVAGQANLNNRAGNAAKQLLGPADDA